VNGGSGQWKRLRSRMGHALDDDDDDDDDDDELSRCVQPFVFVFHS